MTVAVLQHADWEKPGSFGRILAEYGYDPLIVRMDRGERPPPLSSVRAILAMGGPMSVNDDLPWLAPEMDYIRRAVGARIPFFGVCLGAQLLASSLGAPVAAVGPRHGTHPVEFDRGGFRDPVFGGLPRRLRVFQWHGENLGLPSGAVRVAGSPGCPNEAFRVGASAYGVQFHLEVDQELLAEWLRVPACEAELTLLYGPDGPRTVARGLRDEAARMERYARRILSGWLRLVAPAAAMAG